MSPASYLAAPPRDEGVNCSTGAANVTPMDWAIWAALIVGVVATAAATAFLIVRILRAWRDFKRFRRHLGKELDRLADAGEVTVQKLETASDTRELDEAVSRLQISLARLAVLRLYLDESVEPVQRLTAGFMRA